MGWIPQSGGFPVEGNSNPLQWVLGWRIPGQKSLAGYSPWGHKESDMTEQQTLSHNPKMLMIIEIKQQYFTVKPMFSLK